MTSVRDLISVQTVEALYSRAIEIATGKGLPVTSWRDISPSRIRLYAIAELRAASESLRAAFMRSAWITTARGAWKAVVSEEVYGVVPDAATYATPTVTISNTTSGTRSRYYTVEDRDLVFAASISGKTYHNTSGGALGPGQSLTLDLVADDAGSASSVGVDEIDVLQNALAGVVIVSSTAAIARDAQSEKSLEEECLASTAARSDHGPPDAFEYWALQASSEITRATADPDSSTGVHVVYLAGDVGAISNEALAAAQSSIELYACPGCSTPVAAKATLITVNVTVSVSGVDIPPGYETAAEALIAKLIASTRGGQSLTLDTLRGELYLLAASTESSLGGGASQVVITISAPSADVDFGLDEAPVAGTIAVTEV